MYKVASRRRIEIVLSLSSVAVTVAIASARLASGSAIASMPLTQTSWFGAMLRASSSAAIVPSRSRPHRAAVLESRPSARRRESRAQFVEPRDRVWASTDPRIRPSCARQRGAPGKGSHGGRRCRPRAWATATVRRGARPSRLVGTRRGGGDRPELHPIRQQQHHEQRHASATRRNTATLLAWMSPIKSRGWFRRCCALDVPIR
jgi:hypothetical protein